MKLLAAMRLLADMNDDLCKLMIRYIEGEVHFASRKLVSHSAQIPKEFKIVSKPVYRGMGLDSDAVKKLLSGKDLKLKKMAPAWSWSFDIQEATNFAIMNTNAQRLRYGVVIRTLPTPKEVIVSFDAIKRAGKSALAGLQYGTELLNTIGDIGSGDQQEVLVLAPATLNSDMLGAVCLPYLNASWFNKEYGWGLKLAPKGSMVVIVLKPKPYILSYRN